MEIQKSTFRFLAGSLALIITACSPFSTKNNAPTKNIMPAAEHATAAQVPSHPVKVLAKAPPPKKKFFLFNMKHDDVWERIRSDFRLDHDINNPRVQAHIRWFQKHPDYVERVTERASPYIYLIVEELDRRNMPKEVALLPMVESAYNPIAYSPMKAAGLWQMMPGTARGYGIQMNSYYDGRRDVYAATNSALDYLSKLSNDYDGDWLLVFAAYNTGPGNVSKAIESNRRKGKSINYWSLPVANETREYVPRLIALCHVIKHAEEFGINLPKVDNKPHVQMVDVGKQISLDLAAQLADMSLRDLKKYNPGYTSWATSPNGPHLLMLPKSSAEKFTMNFAALPSSHRLGIDERKNMRVASNSIDSFTSPPGNSLIHTIKSGDSLWTLSQRYKVSTHELAAINGISTNTPLKIGQKIKVTRNSSTAVASKKSSFKQKPTLVATQKTVVPKPNPKHSIVAPEKGLNNQKLATTSLSKTPGKIYAVKPGDSVYKIAKQFGVSQKDLFKWNKLTSNSTLKIGQKLRVG